MGPIRQDPYLWIHLAGLAMVPLCLDVCLAGLASARQLLPPGPGIAVLFGLGALPILWMQWQRPFYIFSLGVVTLRPADLTDTQRRLLVVFRSWLVRVLTLLGAVGSLGLGWWLYTLAPLAVTSTPLIGVPRVVGIAIAILAFLACNLFIQVPLSVVGVLLTPVRQIEQLTPYLLSNIPRDFTQVGVQTHRLLPALTPSQPVSRSPASEAIEPVPVAAPEATDTVPPSENPAENAVDISIYEEHDANDPWL